MDWSKFAAYHLRALRLNEIKHGVLINLLLTNPLPRYWQFGQSGHCAVQTIEGLVLGSLTQEECRGLADLTAELDYPGVLGPDLTAHWFASRAAELGIRFHEVEPQQIYALRGSIKKPQAEGRARNIAPDELDLFAKMLREFTREGLPFDPPPSQSKIEEMASTAQYLFWEQNSAVVSMGGIVRVLRTTAGITGIYTPEDYRGHGFAGAITAVLAERIIDQGLVPTLYTDIRNPAANKCYSRLGFEAAYASFHYHR